MAISVPAQYQRYVADAAQQLGIPQQVVAAQIQLESDWNPSARSSAGAEGIAQFEPATFAAYGHGSVWSAADSFAAYVAYMRALLRQEGGNLRNALAAYNAGPGDLAAGQSYASTILSRAGAGGTLAVRSGNTGSGSASATQAGFLSGLQGWVGQITGVSDIAGMIAAVFGPFSNVMQDADQALSATMHGVLWIINPSNWVRIVAGLTGGAAALTGAILVAKAA